MNILTIPLRNLRRKWPRTLMLLAVFSLGVASIVALRHVSAIVGESLEAKLTAFGANILVQPATEKLTVSYGGFSLGDLRFGAKSLNEDDIKKRIDGIELRKNISVVAPKLVTATHISGTQVGIIGVRFEAERALKGYWAVKGKYPTGKSEIIAGSAVASKLKLKPGDSLEMFGRKATIAGVLLPTGSDDDNVILADMTFVQEALKQPGAVSFVEVAALCAGCPIEDIVDQLVKALPGTEVKALQNIVKQRMYSIKFVQQLIMGVSLVILCIACAMVGAAMLSSVNERVQEIGLLRALGFSRGQVFTVFTSEALAIGMVSGVIGYGGGFLLSRKLIATLELGGVIHFDGVALALTVLLFTVVAALAAVFPAWKASKIDPASALVSL